MAAMAVAPTKRDGAIECGECGRVHEVGGKAAALISLSKKYRIPPFVVIDVSLYWF